MRVCRNVDQQRMKVSVNGINDVVEDRRCRFQVIAQQMSEKKNRIQKLFKF
jgi:hypothetical protein